MKKTIYILMIILLMSFASAVIDETGLIGYYEMTDATDSKNDYDLTEVGDPAYSIAYNVGYEEGVYLDGNDALYNTTTYSIISGSLSFCGWFNSSASESYNQRIFTFYDANEGGVLWIRRNDDVVGKKNRLYARVEEDNAGDEYYTCSDEVQNDKENHFTCLIINTDSNEVGLYLDGSLCVNESKSMDMDNLNSAFSIGDNDASGNYFTGYIDEVSLWNRAITIEEMNEMYSNVNWWDDQNGGTPTIPTITCSQNLSSYTNSSENPLYFGLDCVGNVDATIDNWELKMYLNDTLNLTQNVSLNTSIFTLNLTYGDEQVGYDVNITLTHSNDNANYTTKLTDIFLDSIPPDLVINYYGFDNNTKFYHNIETLFNYTVQCSDANLLSCNNTVYQLNSTGSRVSTIISQYKHDINTSTYNISQLLNVGNLTNARYESFTEIFDSHTAVETSNINWYWYDNVLYASGIGFRGDFKQFNKKERLVTYFYKDFDRYKLKVTFDDNSLSHDITIHTPDWVYTQDRYGYLGHFVSIKYGKWLDFQGNNVKSVVITPLGNDYYNVHVEHYYSTDEIEFESIGDLNRATSSFYWNVTDGMTFYARDSIANTSLQNFTITIYNPDNTLVQKKSTTNSNLTFNITTGFYLTNISSDDFTTNTSNNVSYSEGGELTFYVLRAESLYLFFYNEDSKGRDLITETNVTINIINLINGSSQSKTDKGSTFLSGFAPGDYTLEFNAPGYFTNQYYVTITSGSTQQIELYLVPNTTGSLIVFTLQDEKGNPITSSILKRKRWFLDKNAFVLTGMSKSDANGETSQYLVPNDVTYQFIIEKDDIILFSGGDQRIFSSNVGFRIPISVSVLKSYNLISDGSLVTQPLNWDNDTNIISFTWDDSSGITLKGCIEVRKRTAFQEILIGPNCTNSPSATITMNISSYIDNSSTFIAQGYIETNSTFSTIGRQILTKTFGDNFRLAGNTGLFMGYMFIGSMFFLGASISFSIAIVFSVISMIVLQTLGLTFLGWSLIITITVIGIYIGILIKN